MSLPKIQYSIFELEVPSLKKLFKFRPFLVKEEKLLLTAQQSGDIKEMILCLKQVINNCCVDNENILDDSVLSLLDIEYLFLKLRAKSVNNVVDITITDTDDQSEHRIRVDLNDVKIKYDSNHTDIIKVDDVTSLKMRYPNVDLLDKIQQMAFNVEMFFDVIKYCIESVIYEGKTLALKDYSEAEIEEFLLQLTVDGFGKINEFFDTMPRMYHEVHYNDDSGKDKFIVLETLADFFILG